MSTKPYSGYLMAFVWCLIGAVILGIALFFTWANYGQTASAQEPQNIVAKEMNFGKGAIERAKVFGPGSVDNLEKRINEWLESNDIVVVQMNCTSNTTIVLYKPKPKF